MAAAATIPGNGRAVPATSGPLGRRLRSFAPRPPPPRTRHDTRTRYIFLLFFSYLLFRSHHTSTPVPPPPPTQHHHQLRGRPPPPPPLCTRTAPRQYTYTLGERVHLFYAFALVRRLVRRRFFIRYYYRAPHPLDTTAAAPPLVAAPVEPSAAVDVFVDLARVGRLCSGGVPRLNNNNILYYIYSPSV